MTNLDGTPTVTKPSHTFWILFYGSICLSWLLLFVMSSTDQVPSLAFIKDFCVSASDASIFQLTGMWSLMVGAMMLPSFYNFVVVHQDIRRHDLKAFDSAYIGLRCYLGDGGPPSELHSKVLPRSGPDRSGR